MIPRSAIPEIVWPALPDGTGASLLAIQHQLQESQWLPPEELERRQFLALGRVLRRSCQTVPYYRGEIEYLALATRPNLTPEDWSLLPVLTRRDIQQEAAELTSDAIPPDHLPTADVYTLGTTGPPVRATGTRVTNLFWLALTLREHLWQARDLTAKMAAIRTDPGGVIPPQGALLPGWGPATDAIYETGPCAVQGLGRDIEAQVDWLADQDPDYLLTLPSNAVALARQFKATGQKLPRLRQVRCYGEQLTEDVRPACREAWDVDVTDVYSTQELGYLALQCPDGEQYHVQSEAAYVEVINDRGQPCEPGEIGKVVVSTLHNYAMPLLRYEVGDYAEVGSPCDCGRGLPVLTRILGRGRNRLRLSSGEWVWPSLGKSWPGFEPVRQLQLVQEEAGAVEARVIGPRPLDAEEEANFVTELRRRLGHPFRVTVTHRAAIGRNPTLKFEEVLSLLPGANGG